MKGNEQFMQIILRRFVDCDPKKEEVLEALSPFRWRTHARIIEIIDANRHQGICPGTTFFSRIFLQNPYTSVHALQVLHALSREGRVRVRPRKLMSEGELRRSEYGITRNVSYDGEFFYLKVVRPSLRRWLQSLGLNNVVEIFDDPEPPMAA